uniref:Uncharacterized protein n=1 Tax=Oryza brachyantha TaxID=4533 RepID=J3NC08_ORYBR
MPHGHVIFSFSWASSFANLPKPLPSFKQLCSYLVRGTSGEALDYGHHLNQSQLRLEAFHLEDADDGSLVGLLLGAGEPGADVLHGDQVPLRPRVPRASHLLAAPFRHFTAVRGVPPRLSRRGTGIRLGGPRDLRRRRRLGEGGTNGALRGRGVGGGGGGFWGGGAHGAERARVLRGLCATREPDDGRCLKLPFCPSSIFSGSLAPPPMVAGRADASAQ